MKVLQVFTLVAFALIWIWLNLIFHLLMLDLCYLFRKVKVLFLFFSFFNKKKSITYRKGKKQKKRL